MNFQQSQYHLAFLLILSRIVSVNHVMLVNIGFWALVNVRTRKAITEDTYLNGDRFIKKLLMHLDLKLSI